ncbi:16S rRNA (guanine(527)-N(7))-methyltransferase RsmG [Lutispora sp.]|uniref:16S rRNA (guanine(527)-N(7))-methyltransferase RsmG n=1 Tax=Lutispora sp. TaxID=2828727 RepID=UPI002B20AF35|nr:16S rRNA (guanine(527)-N(7))-methyltransferase RsmG [Lutispora sp.]MEA4962704.1 16S rRNA (guanine(527)-N(7))-methyltransferase RsmG [Lutispora sp.]
MNNVDILVKGLERLGIGVDAEKLEKLIAFKDILLDWNEKINLTSITDEKEVYIKHLIDSATCLKSGMIKAGYKVIDIGTGAGFPGMVIKILKDDISMTLLDSLNKRIIYLEDAAKRLALNQVDIIHGRAEEFGVKQGYRESFDIVLSRAVASLNVLVEYCIPYVKMGGYFLCQKGPSYKEELEEAGKAVEILGGSLERIEEYQLPYSDIIHYILIIKKIKNTPTKYPRKPGKPAASPIK